MTGRVVALRPEVVSPDWVSRPVPVTDGQLLDRLLDDVRSAAAQLEVCGPDGREVGRWLRARVGECTAQRLGGGWR